MQGSLRSSCHLSLSLLRSRPGTIGPRHQGTSLICAPPCCPLHSAPRGAGTCLQDIQSSTAAVLLRVGTWSKRLRCGRDEPHSPAAVRQVRGQLRSESCAPTVEGDDGPVLAMLALNLVYRAVEINGCKEGRRSGPGAGVSRNAKAAGHTDPLPHLLPCCRGQHNAIPCQCQPCGAAPDMMPSPNFSLMIALSASP